MKKRLFATVTAVLTATAALLVLLCIMGSASSDVSKSAWAALLAAPTVTEVDPSSAPNDLDTPIVITGTGFSAGLSGTLVITQPMAYLGNTALDDVGWVSTTTLTATVPWGLDSGVYTLTVVNPDGESGNLSDAVTVTQGIGVWNAGELYGGSISHLVVNPVIPTTLYADAGVGLFRSRDGAENWDFKLARSAHHLAVDPLSPDRLYIQGGSHHADEFLWRSDDDGDTWIPLTTNFPITQTSGRDCWVRYQIHTMLGTVYVAACGADGGSSGLIMSTNHGETWLPAVEGLTDTQATALAFHPTDPLTMYLGTASGNVFISHNGGTSWTFASRPVSYVHGLKVNPFGAHEVWVAAGNWLGDPCGLFKSVNPDLTAWTSIGQSGDEWCSANITFAPEAWGETFSGTVFLPNWGVGYKTSDGGDTWYSFGPEGWIHSFALHPTDSDIIYIAEGGWGEGVYKTTDGGATWRVVKQGLTAIVPEQMQIVPDQPDIVYALSLGKVYRGAQGGAIWERLPISGVVSILLDPTTPTRIYAGAAEGVYISENNGQTWPTFAQITKPVEYADCGLWVNELSPVPEQPGTLLAGVRHSGWTSSCVNAHGSIYRSTNYGEDWYRIDLGQEISQVNDLAYDPTSPTVVYAATGEMGKGGGLLKSTDGGETWQPIGVGEVSYAFDVEVEPGTHRVFAWTGPWEGLFVSNDGGASWAHAGSSLTSWNGAQILFVPGSPPVFYIAAGGGPEGPGLYHSTDGAQSWQRAAGELGHVPVYSLAAVTATDRVILYAGTTGGYVEGGAAQAWSQANGDGTLVNAGVYRYTTRITRVYLPLVLRGYGP